MLKLLEILLIFLVAWGIFSWQQDNAAPETAANNKDAPGKASSARAPQSKSARLAACKPASLPANGSRIALDPPAANVGFAGTMAEMHFENQYSTPVVATLLLDGKPTAAWMILSNSGATASVPPGTYELKLDLGTKWCESEQSFLDGRTVRLRESFGHREGRTTEIHLGWSKESESGLVVQLGSSAGAPVRPPAPAAAMAQDNVLELRPDVAGHYRVGGALNGRAMNFLVDTGATYVAISRRAADAAGLYFCQYRGGKAQTANGVVDLCMLDNVTVEFGGFRVEGAQVAVVDNMPGDALLGMEVLRRFSLQQQSGVLRITAK